MGRRVKKKHAPGKPRSGSVCSTSKGGGPSLPLIRNHLKEDDEVVVIKIIPNQRKVVTFPSPAHSTALSGYSIPERENVLKAPGTSRRALASCTKSSEEIVILSSDEEVEDDEQQDNNRIPLHVGVNDGEIEHGISVDAPRTLNFNDDFGGDEDSIEKIYRTAPRGNCSNMTEVTGANINEATRKLETASKLSHQLLKNRVGHEGIREELTATTSKCVAVTSQLDDITVQLHAELEAESVTEKQSESDSTNHTPVKQLKPVVECKKVDKNQEGLFHGSNDKQDADFSKRKRLQLAPKKSPGETVRKLRPRLSRPISSRTSSDEVVRKLPQRKKAVSRASSNPRKSLRLRIKK